jgi:hypothetical protein
MKILALGRYALCVCASVAFLAACSSGGSPLAPLGLVQHDAQLARRAHFNEGPSWMKPDGYTGALLYISDPGADVVNVLTYPNGKRIGKLTGFDQPQGECVDASGDIYITNEGASNVLEYAHGGTTPINTIEDPGQNPYDCAVNLNEGNLTGNFAILNVSSTSGGAGSVSVFGGNEAGTYKLRPFASLQSLAYTHQENVSNIFVDGLDSSGKFLCAVFGPHREKFRVVTLPHTIGSPGAIQWDGKYLAVGDQDGPSGTTVINRFSYKFGNLTFIDAIPLSTQVEQFFPYGSTVVGPYSNAGTVGFWNYPAGGSPTKTLSFFVTPFGSAVSP